ncbi:hypothetical protein NDN08_006311 [Rhodosorus marinus]|uniref:REM-1 domain-containing protein n=1 Tax=Rhodosorus marinus TaxID=101924 RepID=A0AAV8ULV1_9RHOD|nr:hypothetical protein NDN08_006311 [Rhodosorus marinus]
MDNPDGWAGDEFERELSRVMNEESRPRRETSVKKHEEFLEEIGIDILKDHGVAGLEDDVEHQHCDQERLEDSVRRAEVSAEVHRNVVYQNRKRVREAEASEIVKTSDANLARARRILCNRDSAAARRMKDAVYRNELCIALKRLEEELDALERRKSGVEEQGKVQEGTFFRGQGIGGTDQLFSEIFSNHGSLESYLHSDLCSTVSHREGDSDFKTPSVARSRQAPPCVRYLALPASIA